MQSHRCAIAPRGLRSRVVAVACAAAASCATNAHADATFKVLHQFNGEEGCHPDGALAIGPKGRLYGTTSSGGPQGAGTLFELDGTGLTQVHSFRGPDGARPSGKVIVDAAGAIYGATFAGGDNDLGVVYRFDPARGNLVVLHSFAGGAEGANPLAGLARDRDGTLYGTTSRGGGTDCDIGGGIMGCGTVFKLDAASGTLTTLHVFQDGSGIYPQWEPTIAGNLLLATVTQTSTTLPHGGTGYPLEMNKADGSGYELHDIDGLGYGYNSGLARAGFDAWGVVSATLPGEDSHSGGGIYKMGIDGSDLYDMVFVFPEDGVHGSQPVGTLVGDPARGVLYGVTYTGGSPMGGWGTVFAYNTKRLKLTTLHAFIPIDGTYPRAGLAMASDGSLYGVNDSGGIDGCGTVYRVVP
jgi:uncharacterized repeat protein (TIGR03803 family)